MKEFRELVVSLWGLIVFHREHKFGKRLELIASALPVLERVAAPEHANKLGREEAQIIRNGIVEGAKKFIASGVVTDDLAAHATHEPRALLAPEPKLLTGPAIVTAPRVIVLTVGEMMIALVGRGPANLAHHRHVNCQSRI